MDRERIRQTAACWLTVAMATASAAPQKEEGREAWRGERWNVRWRTRGRGGVVELGAGDNGGGGAGGRGGMRGRSHLPSLRNV